MALKVAVQMDHINSIRIAIKGRVLDLSKGAANRLGFVGAGHTNICMAKL